MSEAANDANGTKSKSIPARGNAADATDPQENNGGPWNDRYSDVVAVGFDAGVGARACARRAG